MNPPLVYVFLGASGSGRHELLADIIAGMPDTARITVSLPEATRDEGPALRSLRQGFLRSDWRWSEGELEAEIPEGTTHFFFLTRGDTDPVDQIEALYHWTRDNEIDMGRIVTVVHCRLLFENAGLEKWFDACIHFSDYVLLNRREGVPEGWMKAFQDRYRSAFFPCIFEMVKKGRVKNPALVLDAFPRRISHLFDERELADLDTDLELEEGEADEESEPEAGTDPYLERLPSGRRAREIPDIARFLSSATRSAG